MKTIVHLIALGALAAAALSTAQAQSSKGSGSSTSGGVTIDQARAEAGGASSGDGPGFPVTLSQPGTYRLTGNLTLTDPNATAIVITSPNVTLDLNGFAVLGPVQCAPAGSPPTLCSGTGVGDGIVVNLPGLNARGAVTLANGTVRGMGRHGIATAGNTNDGLRVERMFLTGNGGSGAFLSAGGVVAESQLSYNGQHGATGNRLMLLHNLIRGNGEYGVNVTVAAAGAFNVIQGNLVESNNQMRQLANNLCGLTPCQ